MDLYIEMASLAVHSLIYPNALSANEKNDPAISGAQPFPRPLVLPFSERNCKHRTSGCRGVTGHYSAAFMKAGEWKKKRTGWTGIDHF